MQLKNIFRGSDISCTFCGSGTKDKKSDKKTGACEPSAFPCLKVCTRACVFSIPLSQGMYPVASAFPCLKVYNLSLPLKEVGTTSFKTKVAEPGTKKDEESDKKP